MFKTLSEWIEALQKASKEYVERLQAEEQAKAKELLEAHNPPPENKAE